MKKVILFLLALVMMLTAFIAPMTQTATAFIQHKVFPSTTRFSPSPCD